MLCVICICSAKSHIIGICSITLPPKRIAFSIQERTKQKILRHQEYTNRFRHKQFTFHKIIVPGYAIHSHISRSKFCELFTVIISFYTTKTDYLFKVYVKYVLCVKRLIGIFVFGLYLNSWRQCISLIRTMFIYMLYYY